MLVACTIDSKILCHFLSFNKNRVYCWDNTLCITVYYWNNIMETKKQTSININLKTNIIKHTLASGWKMQHVWINIAWMLIMPRWSIMTQTNAIMFQNIYSNVPRLFINVLCKSFCNNRIIWDSSGPIFIFGISRQMIYTMQVVWFLSHLFH